jgi:hypothetical protein
MEIVLRETPGQKMRAGPLAAEIDQRGLYRMTDGRQVQPQQIHARAGQYPQLFTKEDGYIKLIAK